MVVGMMVLRVVKLGSWWGLRDWENVLCRCAESSLEGCLGELVAAVGLGRGCEEVSRSGTLSLPARHQYL